MSAHQHYRIVDPGQAESDTDTVFRTPAAGGPPMERFDPIGNVWEEDVALVGFFVGDEYGAVKIGDDEAERLCRAQLDAVASGTRTRT